jgi:Protein of unknown function (DUF2752).
MKMLKVPGRRSIAVTLFLGVAAVVVLYVFNPDTHGFYPRCPLFMLTKWQCAGCGTLRAAHCLLHGDISGAIAFNPILVIACPLVALFSFKPALAYKWYLVGIVLIVVIAYSIWRNLLPC